MKYIILFVAGLYDVTIMTCQRLGFISRHYQLPFECYWRSYFCQLCTPD